MSLKHNANHNVHKPSSPAGEDPVDAAEGREALAAAWTNHWGEQRLIVYTTA